MDGARQEQPPQRRESGQCGGDDRAGEAPAIGLADRLYDSGLAMGRLKTGTPARLKKSSIDWDALEQQAADATPVPFSFLTDRIEVPQITCAITRTTEETTRR